MNAIDEIKSRVDIADLVGQYVPLRKAGRNFKANCPFHNERTPSFYVSPDRQTWHCFGACATGGDIFSFVMKRENVEFPEALRLLAQRAGVALPERRAQGEADRFQRLYQANEAAATFFHETLLHAKTGEAARRYLRSRGLDAEAVQAFQLGFSLDSWDALKTHLSERGFSKEELLAAGLLVESPSRKDGGYDRFRGRFMFPIHDDRGRVAGFGARQLEASSDGAGAKYINTPQTPVFDKGGMLYALDRAKEAIRREEASIVVEGYMDVIAAYQHGIRNAVASMGTALTERQIRLLERLRARVLLALDADAAGIEATLRALQEAGQAGAVRAAAEPAHPEALDEAAFAEKAQAWSRDALKRAAVSFYVVPLSGKDPDEMIRNDRAAWDAAVANARPFTDFVFDTMAARRDTTQPRERAQLLQELLPVVRLIEDPVYRAHYLQRLARLTQVEESMVRAELVRPRRQRQRPDAVAAEPLAAPRTPDEGVEEFFLALLLRQPELRAEGTALSPELLTLGEHRAIFTAWRQTADVEAIRETVPEDLRPRLARIMSRDLPIFHGAALHEALQDCVRRIDLRRLSQAKRASAAALNEPDVQPYMSAAVEEAVALQGARSGKRSAPDGSALTSELAARLLADEELGRRLHQGSAARPTEQDSEPSPRSEGENDDRRR